VKTNISRVGPRVITWMMNGAFYTFH